MKSSRIIIFSIFLLALALRLFLVPNRGFEADISFWKSWGLAVYDHNVVWSIEHTNNNYPTPFAYALGFLTTLYSTMADPHQFNEYWNNANVLFLLISKLLPILCDLGIGSILLWVGLKGNEARTKSKQKALPFSLFLSITVLYLFNPVSLLDGAWWGQIDAVGVFLFLFSYMAVYTKKPCIAGIIFMIAMMTKLQNMIYAPLFFLLMYIYTGYEGLIKGIGGAVLAFFGLNIAFVREQKMDLVFRSLTNNYDYFPFLSLNAYNPWWIASHANGMRISDKILTIGIISAKSMGLYLFSASYLLAVLAMLRAAKIYVQKPILHTTNMFSAFFTSLIIVCGAFFLFQTQSHERYAFPIIVFLLVWYLLRMTENAKFNEQTPWYMTGSFRLFVFGYVVFSLLYFANIHTALFINYPQNSIQFLGFLQHPWWTIFLSFGITGFFFLFLFINKKTIGIQNFLFCLVLIVSCLLYLNLPLIAKSPVSLSSLTPVTSTQEYGRLVIDMPVNAAGVSKNWNRLSTQYSFYQKGIGTHAKSTIIYDIGGHFQRLTTDMGIDTEAGPQASVIFRIYGDDKVLYESDIVKRYEYPRHADVSLQGVHHLMLVVDDGGNGNTDDHADWLNPILWLK